MTVDVVVIGAGIAGASAACKLARHGASVVVLEQEAQAGYHATGRSAAMLAVSYGPPALRAVTRASAAFLREPPAGFTDVKLVHEQGMLHVARNDQMAALEAAHASMKADVPDLSRHDGSACQALVPMLDPARIAAALLEPSAPTIDVAALHQGYLRAIGRDGGIVVTGAEVTGIARDGGGWQVSASAGSWRCRHVVNAAGAWADNVAAMAGLPGIGLEPRRRTAIIVDAPPGHAPDTWPMVIDVGEHWYVKPETGRLLVSPADETPSAPCDAQPEELDVAIAVERLREATGWQAPRVLSRWAGLRSFVADHVPVVGEDPLAPGFWWLAGQGGSGVMTAPGLAMLLRALMTGAPVPASLGDAGRSFAVSRLGRTA